VLLSMSGRKLFVAARMLKAKKELCLTVVEEANSLLALATLRGLAWQHFQSTTPTCSTTSRHWKEQVVVV
jgi:hypothetical protein